MKALRLLILALLCSLAFNLANAQIRLPPHPKGPPPPPRLHIKAPRWLKSRHRPARRRVVLHHPPAPRGFPAPPRHP